MSLSRLSVALVATMAVWLRSGTGHLEVIVTIELGIISPMSAFTLLDGVSPMCCRCFSIDLNYDCSSLSLCPCNLSLCSVNALFVCWFFIHSCDQIHVSHLIIPCCPCVSIHIHGQLSIVHMGGFVHALCT